MAQCIKCGSETELYINEEPVCLACSESAPKSFSELILDLNEARIKYRVACTAERDASELYSAVDPNNLDGDFAMGNARRRRSQAFLKYRSALHDFNEYVARSVKR